MQQNNINTSISAEEMGYVLFSDIKPSHNQEIIYWFDGEKKGIYDAINNTITGRIRLPKYWKPIDNTNTREGELANKWFHGLGEVEKIKAISNYHQIPYHDAEKGYQEAQGQATDAFVFELYKAEVLDKQAKPPVSETDDLDLLNGVTPGEWEVVEDFFIKANGIPVVQGILANSLTFEECAANARLIAAAKRLARENKELKEKNKALKKLEATFYTNISRAFNAGKEAMNNQHQAAKNGDPGGESCFLSSHDYFISEFPQFKTNVP